MPLVPRCLRYLPVMLGKLTVERRISLGNALRNPARFRDVIGVSFSNFIRGWRVL